MLSCCAISANLRSVVGKEAQYASKNFSVISQKCLFSTSFYTNHIGNSGISTPFASTLGNIDCYDLKMNKVKSNNNKNNSYISNWKRLYSVSKLEKRKECFDSDSTNISATASNTQDEEYESQDYDDEDDDDNDDYNENEEEFDEEGDESGGDYDSDDEFTNSLTLDVRNDPRWNELTPFNKKRFLYCQRHKNPQMWKHGDIPKAVTTSHFNYKTIKAIKRFPNLGKYSQKSSHMINGHIKTLQDNNINTISNIENGFYFKQPKARHLTWLLNKRETELYYNKNIDYSVQAGDTIKLELYTNLVKKKYTTIPQALVLIVKKIGHNGGAIVIRNAERDGLIVLRQYPIHSPWIKSLEIIKKPEIRLRRRLYYMYNAPASATDHVKYGRKIGVRTRREFFWWLKNTQEGLQYGKDEKLKRKVYFLGMRVRQGWAKKIADLHAGTAIAGNIKGAYKNARREMKYRLRANPIPQGMIRRHKKQGHTTYKVDRTS